MSSDRITNPFPTKMLRLVLGIVGAVVVLVVAPGLIYLERTNEVRAEQSLQTSADVFMQDIRADQLQSAYGRTSAGFQSRQIFEQFQAFVAQYPVLSTYNLLTPGRVNISSTTGVGTQGRVQYTAVSPNNSLSFTLILVEQNGQWRVDSISPW